MLRLPGHCLKRVHQPGRHADVNAVGGVLHHVRHLVPVRLPLRPELDEELRPNSIVKNSA